MIHDRVGAVCIVSINPFKHLSVVFRALDVSVNMLQSLVPDLVVAKQVPRLPECIIGACNRQGQCMVRARTNGTT